MQSGGRQAAKKQGRADSHVRCARHVDHALLASYGLLLASDNLDRLLNRLLVWHARAHHVMVDHAAFG